MKTAISFVLASIVVGAATYTAAAASRDNYRPSQLRDVFDEAAHICGPIMSTAANAKGSARSIRLPDRSNFRAQAVWKGERRPITGETANVLAFAGEPSHANAAVFKTEIHLADTGADYWLPVEERILAAFVQQAGEGVAVELYLTLLGCGARFAIITVDDFRVAARS